MSGSGKSYPAVASRDAEDTDHLNGNLHLEDFAIRFTSSKTEFTFPLADLELEIGNTKEGFVRFSHPAEPNSEITVFGRKILKERCFKTHTHLRQQIEEYAERAEGTQRLVSTGMFFIMFIGLSALLGWLVEAATPKLIGQVPVAYEQELAEEIIQEIKTSAKFSSHTNAVTELNDLLHQIYPPEKHGDYKFRVLLLDEEIPNAFAIPAGNIYVFSGLIQAAESPEEIAGILAHEIAHVTKRHGLRKVIANAGPGFVFNRILGNKKGTIAALAAGSQFLIQQSFSREFEREADDLAWEYLTVANIDPRGLERFLGRISMMTESSGIERALSSHPPSPERIENLQQKWLAMKTKDGFRNLNPITLPDLPKTDLLDKIDKLIGL